MQSIMSHQFGKNPTVSPDRSTFDRSHGYKTTFDAGILIPVYCDEAVPGDTFKLQMATFARLGTPITAVMDNMFIDSFFFAVPYRLIWDNWEKFNGAQDDPGDSTSFIAPVMTAHVPVLNGLTDYIGIPTGNSISYSSFWHRAYNLIWNEWFRDENLQDSLTVLKTDGPDPIANYGLQRRGKRHDYFTSCLPFPQKHTAVTLPLGTKAFVKADTPGTGAHAILDLTGAVKNMDASGAFVSAIATAGVPANQLYADLSTATAATVNQLREAFALQRLYERDARGGTRYTEIILSQFGVTSDDARLQRTEYLGGGSAPVTVHPLPQTSETLTGTPQGNIAGFGTSSGQHGFVKSFTEHCILIGMVCCRADLTYQQGLNRMFSRSIREDFYWPALAHIGEQTVLNKEIFADGGANDNLIFGYQERFAEYRYKPSLITGTFRSNAAGSLDIWHLSQDFSVLPVLNASFIEDSPPIDRIVATPAEPHFLFDAYFSLHCVRPMPVYAIPGLVNHL